ncbi:MAG: putative metallopeptidase [Planctomycetaceae bacterium]
MSGHQFDFCAAMRLLCEDICRRHAAFRHIDMRRVAVTYSQTRTPAEWGIQAKLTPMRFEDGRLTMVRDGRVWAIQRLYHRGQELLYILTFYLPRFLNLSFSEKLVTVFHELYHVGPQFDGDIRRFDGKCYMHTGSQENYDRQMAAFAAQYLRRRPARRLYSFLEHDFPGLQSQFGNVVGLRLSIPRLIAVDDVAA